MDNFSPYSMQQLISSHCAFCGIPMAQVAVRITHPTFNQGVLGDYRFCESCARKLIHYIESQKAKPTAMNTTSNF